MVEELNDTEKRWLEYCQQIRDLERQLFAVQQKRQSIKTQLMKESNVWGIRDEVLTATIEAKVSPSTLGLPWKGAKR